jgi:hypothetical protein
MTRCFYIILALLFFSSLACSAQDIVVSGDVSDGLTERGLNKTSVKIYDAQSNELLASGIALLQQVTEKGDVWVNTYYDDKNGALFSIKVKARPQLKIRIEADGYEPYEKTVSVDQKKKSKKVNLGSIYLAPKSKDRKIGEATVTATKLKFFYKGDTLVYNADAFNVTQTESLRKLVEKLPGTEIKDGVIKVNGKPIENLLISGKNFFNGNIQAALDNLPAYIVKNLKVYNKAGELSELTGRDMHDERYVMDIHLKRQYIGSWIAKLEADAATRDYYGGAAMIMRFDDRQSLMVNGDINNFGQQRNMQDICTMVEEVPYPLTTKVARVDYSYEPGYAWRFRFNGDVERTDEDKDSWNNTETYLSPQNLMSRSLQRSDADNTKVNASTALRFRKKKEWSHELGYTFSYNRARNKVDDKSISYFRNGDNLWDDYSMQNADTIASGAGLLYTLLNPSRNKTTTYTHSADWSSAFTIGGSVLNLKAALKHNTTDTHRFENYHLSYFGDGASEKQRRMYDLHDYALNLDVNADYLIKYANATRNDGTVTPYAGFTHDYGTASHPLYRLERMAEWSDAHSWGTEALGILPEGDFRSLCIDEANSYDALTGRNRGRLGARLSHKLKMQNGAEWRLDADMKGYYEKRKLDYTRDGVLYPIRRDGFFFAPSLSVKWENNNDTVHNWLPSVSVNYSGSPSMPRLTYFLPIRDNADPLNIFLGNNALDNIYTHKAAMRYSMRQRHTGHECYVQGSYTHIHNDVVMSSVYDAAKGIRTYTPENTDRTHRAELEAGYTLPLDKKKHFYLSAGLSSDYYCRADLASLSTETKSNYPLIENYSLAPSLNFRFNMGKLSGYAYWSTSFQNLHSHGTTLHYRTTRGSLDANYALPWGLNLHSFLTLLKNAGSESSEFNRTQVRWNADLSKDLFDGKLTVKLSAHDILDKAGTRSYEYSALSRTESYTNVIPRYFMISLISNLFWTGKKK